jgi:hypothetical protein
MDVLLVDFTGAVRQRWTLDYRYPDPDQLLAEIGARLAEMAAQLGADARAGCRASASPRRSAWAAGSRCWASCRPTWPPAGHR